MGLHPNDRGRTILLPRTLPVTSMDDLTPYHFVEGPTGGYSGRKGAAPKTVREVTADFAEGKIPLSEMLDRIGVPK